MKRDLLWIDSRAGLAVGIGMFALSGWLSPWFGLPRSLLLIIGAANLTYGLYSGWLFRQQQRPRAALVALVVANGAWAIGCFTSAFLFTPSASMFGLGHLMGEGLIVGSMAALEWRRRESLAEGSLLSPNPPVATRRS